MVGLDVLFEGGVVLDLARRDLRAAQLRTLRAESEALAVHVIAIRDRVIHDGGMRIQHARGKLERRLGRQEVLVGAGRRGCRKQHHPGHQQRTQAHQGESEIG
jgi:hypothetical protein